MTVLTNSKLYSLFDCFRTADQPVFKFKPVTDLEEIDALCVQTNTDLQKKITEIMRGIIPFLDFSCGLNIPHHISRYPGSGNTFSSRIIPGYIFKTVGLHGPRSIETHFVTPSNSAELNIENLTNLNRITFANALRLFIKEQNLHRIYIPNKALVKLPIETWDMDRLKKYEESAKSYRHPLWKQEIIHLVAAEKLDITSSNETTDEINRLSKADRSELLEQFLTIILYSSATDLGTNFAFIKSGKHKGKLILFDTEPRGVHEGTESYSRNEILESGVREIKRVCERHLKHQFGDQLCSEVANKVVLRAQVQILTKKLRAFPTFSCVAFIAALFAFTYSINR